jgi:hypothetical protein
MEDILVCTSVNLGTFYQGTLRECRYRQQVNIDIRQSLVFIAGLLKWDTASQTIIL